MKRGSKFKCIMRGTVRKESQVFVNGRYTYSMYVGGKE